MDRHIREAYIHIYITYKIVPTHQGFPIQSQTIIYTDLTLHMWLMLSSAYNNKIIVSIETNVLQKEKNRGRLEKDKNKWYKYTS